VLVDTTPDLRAQALAFRLFRIDAVLYTHGHADHVMGLDDLRRYNVLQHAAIPCYADARTVGELRRTFEYAFRNGPPEGGGVPRITLFPIGGEFSLGGCTVVPVPLLHGSRQILGYRVGSFAYLTDCSAIPPASWSLVEGIDTLVLDALRELPHPTHFTVAQALQVVERLRPRRTYFTHITHDLPHAATCARLPEGVELAYDGLTIEIDVGT
jgi:phosphoribosyl 1,2-cyclic phosphate phosphodiesterase